MCIEASHDHLVLHFINTLTFVASIFGSGEARRGSIPRSGAVTEEQRSQNRKATQPSGQRLFMAQTSLLTPYRPLKGMRWVPVRKHLAPCLGQNPLAANVVVFMEWGTKEDRTSWGQSL